MTATESGPIDSSCHVRPRFSTRHRISWPTTGTASSVATVATEAANVRRDDLSPAIRSIARQRPVSGRAPQTHVPPSGVAPSPVDSVAGALSRIGLTPSLLALVVAGLQAGRPLETVLLEVFSSLVVAPRCPGSQGACSSSWVTASRPDGWGLRWPMRSASTPLTSPSPRATPMPTPWPPALCSCVRPSKPPNGLRAGDVADRGGGRRRLDDRSRPAVGH